MPMLVVNSDPERLWGKTPRIPREELTEMYFTTEALEDGSIGFNIPAEVGTSLVTSVSYSTDEGETWTTADNVKSTEINILVDNVKKGDKILWKGSANNFAITGLTGKYCKFISSGNIDIYGNIMSLLYGDDFTDSVSFPASKTYIFKGIFTGLKIVNAWDLILPATTLANNCYYGMFSNCTSLITAPELPATTLAQQCYENMFSGCSSLTEAPELPATTLAQQCYSRMFYNCTSLTTAPELPATTLTNSCYQYMFYGCTSLNYIKILALSISGETTNWIGDVSPTGTFVKVAGVEYPAGTSGIPSGWTVEEV